MAVYTDSPEFSAALLPLGMAEGLSGDTLASREIAPVVSRILDPSRPVLATSGGPPFWSHLLISEVAPTSNYDLLIHLARSRSGLPDRIACMAGSGSGFHGFKGRPWAALPGNVHLAVHLAPDRNVDRFQVSFTALAAVSVVDALREVRGLDSPPAIKWVNDVVLGHGKVGGVLAYTQSQGERVSSAVLGIGVNADTTPEVHPTPFVPAVSSVRDHLRRPPEGGVLPTVFQALLKALARNYEILLRDGFSPLLERYRAHSMVLGREVRVCAEGSDATPEVLADGRVSEIGDELELILEGRREPITRGRLAIRGPTAYTTQLEPEGRE